MANTNKGRKFFICATAQPIDVNSAGYEGLTWVEVKNIGSIGQTGTDTNIVNYDELSTDVTQKEKGISNAGDPEVEMARNASDAGQDLMRSSAITKQYWAFKVEDDDKVTGPGHGTRYYMRGLVTGPTRPNGRNEDFNLEIFKLGLVQLEVIVEAT